MVRYRLHDLLRQYSQRSSWLRRRRPDDRGRGLASTVDFALHAILQGRLGAARVSRRQITRSTPAVAASRAARPREPCPGLDWLERERTNLGMMVVSVHEHGFHHARVEARPGPLALLHVRGHFDDILATHRAGLASAEALQHRPAIVTMHNYLASALVKTGSHRLASTHLDAADRSAVSPATGRWPGSDRIWPSSTC